MTVHKGPHEQPIPPKTRRVCPFCKHLLRLTGEYKTIKPHGIDVDPDIPDGKYGIPLYICDYPPCVLKLNMQHVGSYSQLIEYVKEWRKNVVWAIHHLLYSWRPR